MSQHIDLQGIRNILNLLKSNYTFMYTQQNNDLERASIHAS